MNIDFSTPSVRTTVLPNLFGRLTAVCLDQGELTALFPRIEEMCRLLDGGCTVLPPSLHPSRLIEDLKARLQRHFEAEETSGYFSAIAAQCPAQLPAIVALKADHVTMLDEIAVIERAAEDYTQWARLSTRARGLMSFLREHEAAETELMRRFLAFDDEAVQLSA